LIFLFMSKNLLSFLVGAGILLSSCEKEEIFGDYDLANNNDEAKITGITGFNLLGKIID